VTPTSTIKWRTIRSAPKDGRLVLLYCPTARHLTVVGSCWIKGGWISGADANWNNLTYWSEKPTHWAWPNIPNTRSKKK